MYQRQHKFILWFVCFLNTTLELSLFATVLNTLSRRKTTCTKVCAPFRSCSSCSATARAWPSKHSIINWPFISSPSFCAILQHLSNLWSHDVRSPSLFELTKNRHHIIRCHCVLIATKKIKNNPNTVTSCYRLNQGNITAWYKYIPNDNRETKRSVFMYN